MQKYDIYLVGYVGDTDFDADYTEYILSKKAGQPVSVKISSFGGDVNTAFRIAAAFREHGDVTVHYAGMNASAATIAGMGAKHISIESSAYWLVHNSSAMVDVFSRMNAEALAAHIAEIRSVSKTLQTIDEGVAGLYATRCRKSMEELSALMRKEEWMTAADALEWGFVDEVIATVPTRLSAETVASIAEMGLPSIPGYVYEEPRSFTERIKTAILSIFEGCKKNDIKMGNITQNDQAESQSGAGGMVESAGQHNAQTTTQPEVQDTEGNSVESETASLQTEIESLRQQIADRDRKIAELMKSAGDTTKNVMSERKATAGSPISAFVSDTNAAVKLFNSLP